MAGLLMISSGLKSVMVWRNSLMSLPVLSVSASKVWPESSGTITSWPVAPVQSQPDKIKEWQSVFHVIQVVLNA